MICPLKFSSVSLPDAEILSTCECESEYCQAWEVKAKYNPETKEYAGDCRLFMLDRKVTGLISTHPS